MAYGLEIYDENGNLRLSTNSMIARLIEIIDVDATAFGATINLSQPVDTSKTAIFQQLIDIANVPFDYSFTSTQLVCNAGYHEYDLRGSSRFFVIAYK